MTATLPANIELISQRRAQVRATVTAVWSEVIGIPASEIASKDNFFSKGDSFAAIVFCARIEEIFGVEMTSLTLVDMPTVDVIVDWLCTSSLTSVDDLGPRTGPRP